MAQPHGGTSRTTSPTTLVRLLTRVTRRFSPSARLVKLRVLVALRDCPIRSGIVLREFHDALCFLRAYPDDPAVLQMVEESLGAFARRVDALRGRNTRGRGGALDDSGAVGTTVYGAFSHPIASWLVDRFPETVEIDWDDPDTEECMGSILSLLGGPVTEESLVEVDTSYRSWVAAAKGKHTGSDLQWLLNRLDQGMPDVQVRRAHYDRLHLPIRWQIREGHILEAQSEVFGAPPVFQKARLFRHRARLRRSLPGLPVPVQAVTPGEATELLDVARAALAVRHRETHAFNFTNPADTLVADLGRGVRIAWFGVLPEQRLPLRAHFGFLILKNDIPVGYGDASVLFEWVDGGGGLNIFAPFRHGEAGFIFSRFVAFLYQHLGVRALHLSRWDIGYGNPEGIESGAFWFYYRLGFRPKNEELRRLAAQEHELIRQRRRYRSSRKTLARLCRVGMFAGLDARPDPAIANFETRRVVQRAAALAAQSDFGKLLAVVTRDLDIPNWQSWVQPERVAFEGLVPILALIPNLRSWPTEERRGLVNAIRAKGGPHEAEYLQCLRGLSRLRDFALGLGASRPNDGNTPTSHNSVNMAFAQKSSIRNSLFT
jgi:hypothetical protein